MLNVKKKCLRKGKHSQKSYNYNIQSLKSVSSIIEKAYSFFPINRVEKRATMFMLTTLPTSTLMGCDALHHHDRHRLSTSSVIWNEDYL